MCGVCSYRMTGRYIERSICVTRVGLSLTCIQKPGRRVASPPDEHRASTDHQVLQASIRCEIWSDGWACMHAFRRCRMISFLFFYSLSVVLIIIIFDFDIIYLVTIRLILRDHRALASEGLWRWYGAKITITHLFRCASHFGYHQAAQQPKKSI